jgi:ribonuclease HII
MKLEGDVWRVPVVAAAVILPKDFSDGLLTDSKKLTARQRQSLIQVIKHHAIEYAIAEVDHVTIDAY